MRTGNLDEERIGYEALLQGLLCGHVPMSPLLFPQILLHRVVASESLVANLRPGSPVAGFCWSHDLTPNQGMAFKGALLCRECEG